MDTNQRLAGLHILIVEDDPDGLDLLLTLLSFNGARVAAGVNGVEGLSLARELNPMLIISDLSMPEMDGWTMVKELKKDSSTLDIPIIALSAHAMRGDREKAMASGCHNYLTKPIDPYTFIDTLLVMLEELPRFFYKTEE